MKRLLSSTTIVSLALMPVAPMPSMAQVLDETGRILAADGTVLCVPTADLVCDLLNEDIIKAATVIQERLDLEASIAAQAAADAAAQAEAVLKQDPFAGHLFVFRGRRGDLVKVIWWDGQGACMFMKRLEKGRFVWPSAKEGKVALTPAQLSMLLEGIDWRAPQRTWRPLAQG